MVCAYTTIINAENILSEIQIAGLLTQESINVEMSLSLTLDKSFAPETNPVIEYGDSVTLIEKMMETEDNSTSCSSCDATFLECGGYSAE